MRARAGLSGFSLSAPLIWPLLTGLRALGADVEAIVADAGLSLPELQDPDTRIPIEGGVALAFAAGLRTGDEALGIHLAEKYVPGVFGLLDYLAHSSRTLGEAIRYLCRYNRLLQDAVETHLDVRDDRAIVWQEALGGFVLHPGIVENAIANLIVIGRDLTAQPFAPIEVQFKHSEPSYSSEIRRVFGAPVRFGAERDGVVLAREALDLPLVNADPMLCVILDRHARRLLEELPRVPHFSQRVRELVLDRLKEGAPTAAQIAAELHMSTRTLKRRLQQEETSYEALVDGLRRALVERYLDEPTLSTEEIALMLGYSAVSPFRRAFRRWFGVTPSSFRRERRMRQD